MDEITRLWLKQARDRRKEHHVRPDLLSLGLMICVILASLVASLTL